MAPAKYTSSVNLLKMSDGRKEINTKRKKKRQTCGKNVPPVERLNCHSIWRQTISCNTTVIHRITICLCTFYYLFNASHKTESPHAGNNIRLKYQRGQEFLLPSAAPYLYAK
jgi:hypothetical protein